MSGTLTWRIGELDYMVEVDRFVPGTPDGYWDPGDPPEIELSPFVHVFGRRSGSEIVTWDTFLADLALDRGMTLAEADDAVHHEAVVHEEERAWGND